MFFLLIVMPFLIFSKRFGIGFLPNTVYAKALSVEHGADRRHLRTGSEAEFIRSLHAYPVRLLPVVPAREPEQQPAAVRVRGRSGCLRLVFSLPYDEGSRYRSFLIPLAVVLFPLAIGIFVPFGTADYQEGRYIAPVAPLMLIIGTVGMYGAATLRGARILSEAKFMGRPRALVLERALIWFLMIVALFAQFRSGWYRGRVYGREVANIEEMQVSIGKWLDQNLPRDAVARGQRHGRDRVLLADRQVLDTVWAHLAGGPPLPQPRRAARDAGGSGSSRTSAPTTRCCFRTGTRNRAAEAISEPIHRVVLDENVICGGQEMVVYKLNWDGLEAPRGGRRAEREQKAAG